MAAKGKSCRVARHQTKRAAKIKAGMKPKKKRVKVTKRAAKIKAGMKPKVHRAKKSKAKLKVANKGACGTPAPKPDLQTVGSF